MSSRKITIALAFLFFCGGGGCATVESRPGPAMANSDEHLIHDTGESLRPTRESASTTPPGTIARSELAQVLARPAGDFLANVDVEAVFSGRHFAGWRLRSFYPGDPRFAGVDLVAGDVVTRVNGSSVERPEQFMTVWQAANRRKTLVVEVLREGLPRTLTWAIID